MKRQETVSDFEFGFCFGFGIWSLGFQLITVSCQLPVVSCQRFPHE